VWRWLSDGAEPSDKAGAAKRSPDHGGARIGRKKIRTEEPMAGYGR
jgi:hypothetical protein